jgi:hypothetical protein
MTYTVAEFGRRLIVTQDLDPVYSALSAAKLDFDTLARLCVAYWCFYHLGAAAKLAEIKEPKRYWAAMNAAAYNASNSYGSKPWPRGAERRHFRGAQATRAMLELSERYRTPQDAFYGLTGTISDKLSYALYGSFPATYGSVARAVKLHRGFGDWIAFKIADMSERVCGIPVDFNDCHLGIYKEPRQGAAVAFWGVAEMKRDPLAIKPWDKPITDDQLRTTVTKYVNLFAQQGLTAPPQNKRLINVQEVETVFCKYKSHLKGRYPVGKDTLEVFESLYGWGDLARQFQYPLNALIKEYEIFYDR